MHYSLRTAFTLLGLPYTPAAARAAVAALAGRSLEIDATVETLAEDLVVVGFVQSVAPHPGADRLRVAQVDTGAHGIRQIVCGAANLRAQVHVPVSLPGAVLPGGLTISAGKIRDVESNGMICSADELALPHPGAVDGIILLDDLHPSIHFANYVGQPLSAALPFWQDTVIEVGNTSLSTRPDLMGHRGFARELQAVMLAAGLPAGVLSASADEQHPLAANSTLPLQVRTPGDRECRSYLAARINGVGSITLTDEQAAFAALLGIGMGAHPLVTLSNIAFARSGQPLHFFDAALVRGGITVRMAAAGESFTDLMGVEHALDERDIVIADEAGVLALAGVMGGQRAAVSAATQDIIIESASFDAVSVRATSWRHGLRSDAASAFEKTLASELAMRGLREALSVLRISPQDIVAYADFLQPSPIVTVRYRPHRAELLSGLSLPASAQKTTLLSLGITVEEQADGSFLLTPPAERATKDLTEEVDFAEEIIRLHGLQAVQPQPMVGTMLPPYANAQRTAERRAKAALAAAGATEAMLYSFINEDLAKSCLLDVADMPAVENPLSSEYTHLRSSLLPRLLQHGIATLRHDAFVSSFEIGRVFRLQQGSAWDDAADKPYEDTQLGILAIDTLKAATPQQLYARGQALLAAALRAAVLPAVDYLPAGHPAARGAVLPAYFHPAGAAVLLCRGSVVGFAGALHPAVAATLPAGHSAVFFQLSLPALLAAAPAAAVQARTLPAFPAVVRDISVAYPYSLHGHSITKILAKLPHAESVEAVSTWEDAALQAASQRSATFRITFRSSSGTLGQAEVDAAMATLPAKLEKEGASVR